METVNIKFVDLKKLRDVAHNIDKSIRAASLYNDKAQEKSLMRAQLIILKLAQHLENSFFEHNSLANLEPDIAGVFDAG
jgi:hypothetical protein